MVTEHTCMLMQMLADVELFLQDDDVIDMR